MSNLFELKTSQEFVELNDEGKIIVLDFYADWCAPCKLLGNELTKLSPKYSNITFLKVNVENEECEELVDKFEVTGIPRVIVIKNKAVEADISGNKLKELITCLDMLSQ